MGGVSDVVGDVVSVGSMGLIDGDEFVGGITGENAGRAARNAADAQLQGIRESNQLQREMFNAQAGITDFQRGIGNQALSLLGGMYGLQGGYNPAGSVTFGPDGKLVTTPGEPPAGGSASGTGVPNWQPFLDSPDYQFALEQGQRGLDATASAGGNLFGGNRMREAARFNSGLASQQLGNFQNRLASLAGIGTNTTNQLGQTLQNTGNNISQGLMGMGDARASGYVNQANAQQSGWNNLFNLGGQLGSAAIFACDRRLKTDIEHVGDYRGHKWYRFKYLWGDKGEGPMADEVMQTRPDAVLEGPNGLLFVNIGAL